nr:unnamed protein product [Ipomoea batatas]
MDSGRIRTQRWFLTAMEIHMISEKIPPEYSSLMARCFLLRMKCMRRALPCVNGEGKMQFGLKRRKRKKRKPETRLLKKGKSIRKLSMRKESTILRLTRPITRRRRSHTGRIKRSSIKKLINSIGKP